MSISPTSFERASNLTGLSTVKTIHVDDLRTLKIKTLRLAEFLDRMDHLETIDLATLPPINLKPFGTP